MVKKPTYTDREMVEGCLRNDRHFQEALYKRFFDSMYRMVCRYTEDQELALEMLNNGFLRVFKKLDTFGFKGSLEGWIRRLVFHAISDHFRRQPEKVHFLQLEDQETPQMAQILGDLYYEDMLKLVDMLPDASRRVFLLYAIEGYAHAEIAAQLNISEGTSKWHLSNARQKLKELMQDHFKINYHAG